MSTVRYTGSSAIGVPQELVVAPAGAGFTTITGAIANITSAGLTGNVVIVVMPGTYVESFTVPDNVSILGVGIVNITGTVTLTASATLTNLIITSVGATSCISASQGGSAATSAIELDNISLISGVGGIGLLAAASFVTVLNGLTVAAASATGVSLLAGDVAAEVTRFKADWVRITGAIVTAGITTAGGTGAAGVDQVRVEIGDLFLEGSGASIGCVENSGGTQLVGLPSGFFIDAMHCNPAAAATTAWVAYRGSDALGVSWIGSVDGLMVNGILFDMDAGLLTVGEVNFPNTLPAKVAWQVATLGGGNLIIQGGQVLGGDGSGTTDGVFSFDAVGSDLSVSNFTLSGVVDGERIINSGAALTNTTTVTFTDCELVAGSAAGAADEIIECLGAGATAPLFTFRRCRIHQSLGAAAGSHVITTSNADLVIEDCYIQQSDQDVDCIEYLTSAIASSFEWRGDCTLDQATGSTGRALTYVDEGNCTLIESGLLRIIRCTGAEQLGVAATTAVNLTNNVGAAAVAQGFLTTWVAADFALGHTGFGVGSSYPGLHIAEAATLSFLGGAGADATNVATVTNTDTTATATATFGVTAAAGVQDGNSVVLSTPLLVGNGQLLTIIVTTATTPSLDTQITVL